MARYTGPKCRKCRRYGVSLCGTAKCALIRRQNPPGPRPTRRRKISDRGQQLIEKQKVRFAYGLMEGQFRRYYDRAHRRGGVAGNNLMQFLEERLDNVVYRLGFGGTRAQARQLVSHGLIAVDGKKLSIPSARVRVGQEISFTDRGKKSNFYKIVKEDIAGRDVPGWLEVNPSELTARVSAMPTTDQIPFDVNTNLIVEFYR